MTRGTVAALAAVVLVACAAPSSYDAGVARSPNAPQVCVVSTDGDESECPEIVAAPPEDDDEPCIERRNGDAFAHGPGARIDAFCTPAQAARRAARALSGDEDEDDDGADAP